MGAWVVYLGVGGFCGYSEVGERPRGDRRSWDEMLVMLLAPTDRPVDDAYDPLRKPTDEADEKEP